MKFLIIILFLIGSTDVFAGGGWTSGKGKGFFKLSEWWVTSDKYYNDFGVVTNAVSTGSIYRTNIYGEYGISDKFDVNFSVPLLNISSQKFESNSSFDNQNIAFGDVDFCFKYGLIQGKKVVLSTYLTLGIPLGDENLSIQTGDGEFNQKIGLVSSSSHQIGKINTFYSLSVDFNNRTNNYSDELNIGLTLGAIAYEKFIFVYRLNNLHSFKNGSRKEKSFGVFSNNIEYLSSTYELGFQITPKFGVSAEMGTVFYAKNIFASPSYSIGTFIKI